MGFKGMRKTTTLARSPALVLLALFLALPATAAARVVAPPGNSEADQYFETLPGSTGPRGPDATKTPEDAVRDGRLSAATDRALQQRGAAGQGVAGTVAKTAPPGGAGGSSLPPATVGAPEKRGLGALFPLTLVATAAAAIAFVVVRRRRRVSR
jgi:hypothetical protein